MLIGAVDAALTTFFTPASQKPPEKMSWQVVDTTLLVGRYANDGPGEGQEPAAVPRKVAAFDLVSLGRWNVSVPMDNVDLTSPRIAL